MPAPGRMARLALALIRPPAPRPSSLPSAAPLASASLSSRRGGGSLRVGGVGEGGHCKPPPPSFPGGFRLPSPPRVRLAALHGARRAASARVARSESFSVLEERDLEFFRSVVGEGRVVTDEDELEAFNVDWMRKYRGGSKVVLKPKTTEEVSALLGYCNGRMLAVVPQGGNTGLVGGSVAVHDEVVLSTNLMNQIESFSPESGALVCQAGCVLEALDQHVAQQGFIMPLDLGAKGSCHIGGNVATNAGGLRLLRYGSLHGSVLGLEVVLADGTVLDSLTCLRKDNTGYDLKQLFIGAEGTLGVVTRVAVLCPIRPTSVQVAVVACQGFPELLSTVRMAQGQLCEIVSALEFLDQESMKLVLRQMPEHCRDPLESPYPFYLLIETSGSKAEHDTAKLEAFLEAAMEDGCVVDGVVAQDETQAKDLWKLREKVPVALAEQAALHKYDVSLPQAAMYDLVLATRSRLSAAGLPAVAVGYGHLGDGNLHLNVYAERKDEAIESAIEPFVYEWTRDVRGSVSAEHGLGLMKADCMGYSKTPEAVRVMRGIKKLLDPNNILNPYKVLPNE